MSELTFGMRLNFEGQTATAGLEEVRNKMESITGAGSKMASQYTGINQAVKQHSDTVAQTTGNVGKLLDKYDPLGAKLRQLQQDFKALDQAAAAGKIAGADDARTDLVYARMTEQMKLFSGASDQATISAGQLRNATRQLPMQFTDIWTSLAAGQAPLTVLMQQGGQIKDSFGGIENASRAVGGYLMGLINPVTMVAAAVAAGGYAWYEWGKNAQRATDEATAGLEKARKEADSAQRLTNDEKLQNLKYQIESKKHDAQFEADRAANDKYSNEQKMLYAKTAGELRRTIEGLERQEAELQAQIDKEQSKGADAAIRKRLQEKDSIDKTLAAEEGKFIKLKQLDGSYSDNAEQQAKRRLANDLENIDREYIANVEALRKKHATQADFDKLKEIRDQTVVQREKNGAQEIQKAHDDAAKKMNQTWKTFADSTQRTLGDVLYNGMNGTIVNIEDMFKQMIFRITANMAAAKLTEAMFGKNPGSGGTGDGGAVQSIFRAIFNANGNAFGASGVVPFANGGAFGNGMVLNEPTMFGLPGGRMAVAGEAGYEGALPLKRMSSGKLGVYADVGSAQGGSAPSTIVIQDNKTIQIDSRSDRAQILADVNAIVANGNRELLDSLHRQGKL